MKYSDEQFALIIAFKHSTCSKLSDQLEYAEKVHTWLKNNKSSKKSEDRIVIERSTKAPKPFYTPWKLSESEHLKMNELESTVVKLEAAGGIGIKVSCLTPQNEWVDITDYSNW